MTMNPMGCQGRDHTPTLTVKTCPECGSEVEVFSIDTSVQCDTCGFTVYNDAVSCVEWCKYGRQCVGEEEYGRLMDVVRTRREQASAQAEG